MPFRKKSGEKALIPLPPAEFVSFFFAKAAALRVKGLRKPAVGGQRCIAISRCERFCKELKRRCIAPRSGHGGSRPIEAPV